MVKDRKVILEQNYSIPNITEKNKKKISEYPQFFRGHVRTCMGKLHATDEFDKQSDRIINKKMP